MIGAFVQLNLASRYAQSHPIGYVVCESGCWEWTGNLDEDGYGRWGERLAHRSVYELHHGSIPPKHELHHRCENPPCVNPAHLEPVLRQRHPGHPVAINAAKTHCARGHLFDEANTRIASNGSRHCRRCHSRWTAEYNERKSA